jgi:hypothetical protein
MKYKETPGMAFVNSVITGAIEGGASLARVLLPLGILLIGALGVITRDPGMTFGAAIFLGPSLAIIK